MTRHTRHTRVGIEFYDETYSSCAGKGLIRLVGGNVHRFESGPFLTVMRFIQTSSRGPFLMDPASLYSKLVISFVAVSRFEIGINFLGWWS